jgi:hypothetical protein
MEDKQNIYEIECIVNGVKTTIGKWLNDHSFIVERNSADRPIEEFEIKKKEKTMNLMSQNLCLNIIAVVMLIQLILQLIRR